MDLNAFKGLNNVTDPLRAGLGWLAVADNVVVTDTGGLAKRSGYTKVATGSFSGAYCTKDFRRMYLVDGGVLRTREGAELKTGLSNAPMYWTEVNNEVYFNNGTDSGVIAADNAVREWRGADVSGAYGAGYFGDDGKPLAVLFDTLPHDTDVIQYWGGRIYAAQYLPSEDQTVVWYSEPLAYHLFNLDSNFFIIQGRALMLAPTESALIVGTATRISAYDGDKLTELANYGVIPGQHWDEDGSRTLFWTTRGVCAALPFTNLTEKSVSVAPGLQAGGTIVRSGGQKRYVVALHQGGSAFNAFS